MLALTSTKRQY